MEDTVQPTSGATPRYAGFWIRLLAGIIDSIILGIITRIFFGSGASTAVMQDGGISYNMSLSGPQMLVPILYMIGFWGFMSTTPGGMVLKLQLTDEQGNKISWGAAVLRYLGTILSGIALGIGFMWVGWDKKKQGWHDKIAKTYVIRK